MCFYIGIKDLAANGLIEMLKVNEKNRFISYNQIKAYGEEVVRSLNESGNQAVLILSGKETSELLHDYSDYFEEAVDFSGEPGIQLESGKNVRDLIRRFRTYLALDVLLKFMDVNILKKTVLQEDCT